MAIGDPKTKKEKDEELEEALEETYPASDPPGLTPQLPEDPNNPPSPDDLPHRKK